MRLQRRAAVIRLRPEKEDDYRRLHAAVWPDVLAALKQAGVRNYSIFLRGGLLFSYMEYEGEDFERSMALVAQDAATRRWWTLTDPCQEPFDSAEATWWAPMEEVFHCD